MTPVEIAKELIKEMGIVAIVRDGHGNGCETIQRLDQSGLQTAIAVAIQDALDKAKKDRSE